MGDILSGEFENPNKCEQRVYPLKVNGLSRGPYTNKKEQTKRVTVPFYFFNERCCALERIALQS